MFGQGFSLPLHHYALAGSINGFLVIRMSSQDNNNSVETIAKVCQGLGNACFQGPAACPVRGAGRSNGCKWIAGPITTVRNGHIAPKALADTTIALTAWEWLTEGNRSGAVVLGTVQ